MLLSLLNETLLTYALVMFFIIFFGSHTIIFLLSMVGLLLRPFSRQPVALLYPWVRLSAENPDDISETPFRPSRLLLVHTLWFMSSVVVWVGLTLICLDIVLNELFPSLVDIEDYSVYGMRVSASIGYTILAMYASVFALWSSRMWVRSLSQSLAYYRRMNGVRDGGLDDPGHYLAPFRKTSKWAIATWPLLFGFGVLAFTMFPPFQG